MLKALPAVPHKMGLQVLVTAHPASLQQQDIHNPVKAPARHEWRVLRFVTADGASQQSVAKVGMQAGSESVVMHANCLGFEYTKTLAASGGNIDPSPAAVPPLKNACTDAVQLSALKVRLSLVMCAGY